MNLQALLHPWIAFGIMPLFSLANAGVDVRGMNFDSTTTLPVMAGVAMGLVLGKPLGILAASYLTVRLGIAALPKGMTWGGVAVVGCVAGIGFTMAIFIADLAFASNGALGAAKVAILVGSSVAAVVGVALGRLLLPSVSGAEAAIGATEAESSSEHREG